MKTKPQPIVSDSRTVNLSQFIDAVHRLAEFFKTDNADLEIETHFESYTNSFIFKAESAAFCFDANFNMKGGTL